MRRWHAKQTTYPRWWNWHIWSFIVFLTSWTFAYESNVFLSWARSYANFKKAIYLLGLCPITCVYYFWLTLVDFSLPKLWLDSPKEIYFRSKTSLVQATHEINNTHFDPGHRYKFSFSITQTQSEQWAKSQSKTVTCHLLRGNLPQLWDGFILSFKFKSSSMLGTIKSY